MLFPYVISRNTLAISHWLIAFFCLKKALLQKLIILKTIKYPVEKVVYVTYELEIGWATTRLKHVH